MTSSQYYNWNPKHEVNLSRTWGLNTVSERPLVMAPVLTKKNDYLNYSTHTKKIYCLLTLTSLWCCNFLYIRWKWITSPTKLCAYWGNPICFIHMYTWSGLQSSIEIMLVFTLSSSASFLKNPHHTRTEFNIQTTDNSLI